LIEIDISPPRLGVNALAVVRIISLEALGIVNVKTNKNTKKVKKKDWKNSFLAGRKVKFVASLWGIGGLMGGYVTCCVVNW